MKLTIENLGPIKGPCEIEPKKLTVFCGRNNTGKTYAMYALWSLDAARITSNLDFVFKLVDELKNKGSVKISIDDFCKIHWDTIEKSISDMLEVVLPILFGSSEKYFSSTKISTELSTEIFQKFITENPNYTEKVIFGAESYIDFRIVIEEGISSIAITLLNAHDKANSLLHEKICGEITELVLRSQHLENFLLPAERGGINLFYKDMPNVNANINSHNVKQKNDSVMRHHAAPLIVYVNFLKDLHSLLVDEGVLSKYARELQEKISKASYSIIEDGSINVKTGNDAQEIGLHQSSSTVKNLFGLWAWLSSTAKPNACLMIDEPELNLHPDNQRLVARLLVRLVNSGLRVVISTHSDYIVREINNMIMLASEFPEREKLERDFGYANDGSERIKAEDVAAYHFTENSVDLCEISPAFGIEVKSMDAAINKLNKANSEIYYALDSARNPE